MFHPVNRKKLIQKLEKHPRPENLNSLKIKKIWSESFNQKPDPQIQRSENTKDAGLYFKSCRSNFQSH